MVVSNDYGKDPAKPGDAGMQDVRELLRSQADMLAAQGDGMAAVMAQAIRALQAPRDPALPRPMPVAFDVERDDKGLIARIVPVYTFGTMN